MIYDCFPFFNELDLLEIRLNELSDVVDKFVLVEADRTHAGRFKPLYFEMNKTRFTKFFDKIIHIVVINMPMTPEEIQAAISPQDRHWLDTGYQLGDNWVRERFQRNAMMIALIDCDPNDIIIIEDADEMVRAEIIANLDATMCDGSNAVMQTMHTYFINWECKNMPWAGTKILRRKFVDNPSEHRFHTPASCFIHDGGWHFNFLGGYSAIKRKLAAYAHQEFNTNAVLDNIDKLMYDQKDLLGRSYEYEIVPIDESYPKYLQENIHRFPNLVYKDYR